MKLVRTGFVKGRRLFGLRLGRNGWQFGVLLSEDRSAVFIGWFRDAAHSRLI